MQLNIKNNSKILCKPFKDLQGYFKIFVLPSKLCIGEDVIARSNARKPRIELIGHHIFEKIHHLVLIKQVRRSCSKTIIVWFTQFIRIIFIRIMRLKFAKKKIIVMLVFLQSSNILLFPICINLNHHYCGTKIKTVILSYKLYLELVKLSILVCIRLLHQAILITEFSDWWYQSLFQDISNLFNYTMKCMKTWVLF